MRDAVCDEVADAEVLVMAAAVADYRAAQPAAQKIKKGSSTENADGSLTLHLVRNPDILAEARRGSLTGRIDSGRIRRRDDRPRALRSNQAHEQTTRPARGQRRL